MKAPSITLLMLAVVTLTLPSCLYVSLAPMGSGGYGGGCGYRQQPNYGGYGGGYQRPHCRQTNYGPRYGGGPRQGGGHPAYNGGVRLNPYRDYNPYGNRSFYQR